jgi:hypothetical protein
MVLKHILPICRPDAKSRVETKELSTDFTQSLFPGNLAALQLLISQQFFLLEIAS